MYPNSMVNVRYRVLESWEDTFRKGLPGQLQEGALLHFLRLPRLYVRTGHSTDHHLIYVAQRERPAQLAEVDATGADWLARIGRHARLDPPRMGGAPTAREALTAIIGPDEAAVEDQRMVIFEWAEPQHSVRFHAGREGLRILSHSTVDLAQMEFFCGPRPWGPVMAGSGRPTMEVPRTPGELDDVLAGIGAANEFRLSLRRRLQQYSEAGNPAVDVLGAAARGEWPPEPAAEHFADDLLRAGLFLQLRVLRAEVHRGLLECAGWLGGRGQ